MHDNSQSHDKPSGNGGDIGFTFEEAGTKQLEDGRTVPKLNGKPNDPAAHRRFIEWIEKNEGKTPTE